jgi:RimJ/RimL family protein N-acetyltransferase
MALQVWPHNAAAIALYERFGFERECYLRRHYRRRSGELWDAIVMGLRLD